MVEIIETKPSNFAPLYDVDGSIEEKINTIATEIYGADGVDFTAAAKKQIKEIENLDLIKCQFVWQKLNILSLMIKLY